MTREITRRTLLQLLGGVAAGVALSPLPWKGLDDAAIWTQNWSWLPRNPRGPRSLRRSTCTLCPAGCGIAARCVGGLPYQLVGIHGHPAGGALCPLGLAAHHLSCHPARRLSPVALRFQDATARALGQVAAHEDLSPQAAVGRLADWVHAAQASGTEHAVVVLSPYAESTSTLLYRRFLHALGCGTHVDCDPRQAPFAVLQGMLAGDVAPTAAWSAARAANTARQASAAGAPFGFDLEHARTIVTFGAPLFDGGLPPGRAADLVARRATQSEEQRPWLIQVETRPSRTALLADRWLAVAPGSEAALALGLGHLLVAQGQVDRAVAAAAVDFAPGSGGGYLDAIAEFTPEHTSRITGVPVALIRETADAMAAHGPALVLPGSAPGGRLDAQSERAVWALGLLTGNVGRAGALVTRRPLPAIERLSESDLARSVALAELPDGAIHVLILDPDVSSDHVPWAVLARKLSPREAHVVSLSPFAAGLALRADLQIPAPAPLESLREVPTPFGAPAAQLALSAPLLAPPAGAAPPETVLAHVCAALGITMACAGARMDYVSDDGSAAARRLLERRLQTIHATRRGSVFRASDGQTVALRDVPTPEDLQALLLDGGCWSDSALSAPPRLAPHGIRLLGSGREGVGQLLQRAGGSAFVAASDAAHAGTSLVAMPFSGDPEAASGALPPLLSKLYRESRLRPAAGEAWMHPQTARRWGLRDGDRAELSARGHAVKVSVRCNRAVLFGVVHVAVGPRCDAFGDRPPDSSRDSACADGLWALCPPDELGCGRWAQITARRVQGGDASRRVS